MLNPEVYRQAVSLQGEQVRWLKAMPHTCYDPRTDYDHQRGCDLCLEGYLYREQTLAPGVRALVQSVRHSFMHPDLGWVQEGQLQVTTMPDEIPLGPMDRLVLLEREMEARERVTKGEDTLTHPDVARVEELSDTDHVYVVRRDYTVNVATGVITWVGGGDAPAGGALYAAHYFYRPVFWFIAGEQTVSRPMPLTGGQGPIRGYLYWKRPGEG